MSIVGTAASAVRPRRSPVRQCSTLAQNPDMSQSPLSARHRGADNRCMLRCPCSAWKLLAFPLRAGCAGNILDGLLRCVELRGELGWQWRRNRRGHGWRHRRQQSCLQRDVHRSDSQSERFRSVLQQQLVEYRHLFCARRSEFQQHHQQLGRFGERSSRLGQRSDVRHSLCRGEWQPAVGECESAGLRG